MTLDSLDIQQTHQELNQAVKFELPKIMRLRDMVKELKVYEIGYRHCFAIAPVATDGGENRLSFEPMNIEVLRVVDSEGHEHIQKIIPLSFEPEIIKRLFETTDALAEFLQRLEIDYEELSYLLPSEEYKDRRVDPRGSVRILRDIMEWAVLLKLAWNPSPAKILLIRDGLLRTKSLKIQTVEKMSKSFREAYEETGGMVLGVAKKSKVLNYLSLALSLEQTFYWNHACYCEIPEHVEKECYNWSKTWLEGPTFGKLHLVKLSKIRDSILLPVDVPDWLLSRRKEVLEYLAYTAETSFPTIGYPYPLQKAHENAVLHGLEMEILSHYLKRAIMEFHDENERGRILEYISFNRGIIKGGVKEYG